MVQKPWVSKKESARILSNPPTTPPPPPPQLKINVESENLNVSTTSKMDDAGNLLLRSVNAVETEFWSRDGAQRKPGLLVLAVNHIYKDVYRLPLSLS